VAGWFGYPSSLVKEASLAEQGIFGDRTERPRAIDARALGFEVYGILGGMGPLAGLDLMRRIIELTRAAEDYAHIPLVLYSIPQIPDRSFAILHGGRSPLPALIEGVRALAAVGAQEVAIACNTAHHWQRDLCSTGGPRILHVVDAVQADLVRRGIVEKRLGLLATTGTIASGFYQRELRRLGHHPMLPSESELQQLIMPAIAEIKAGHIDVARRPLVAAAEELFGRGAEIVILACSELGLVLRSDGCRFLDSTDALAAYCVARWTSRDYNGRMRPLESPAARVPS
jgi:aspartate racemase